MNTPPSGNVVYPPDPSGEDESAVLRADATALARQDGRSEARTGDRSAALREQTGPPAETPPETPAGAEELVTWDARPDETGHRSPESVPDDEADVAAALAEEGAGEAETELRRAANDEEPPRHRKSEG